MRGFESKKVCMSLVSQLIVIVLVGWILYDYYSLYVKKRIGMEYLLNDDVHTVAILERYLLIELQIKICHELSRMETCRGVIPLSFRLIKQRFLY
jgi:hypothetical protein